VGGRAIGKRGDPWVGEKPRGEGGTHELGGDPQVWGSPISVGQPHKCGAEP